MADFGGELRRLLAARGMSLREAARRVPCDSGYLSKVAAGRKHPSADLAARLDEVLEAGGDLAVLATPRAAAGGFMDPDDAERFARAAVRPERADAAVAGSLAAMLAQTRLLEDHAGAGTVLAPAAAHLGVAESMAAQASGPARRALVHVAGQWAQFHGWLLAATGKIPAGQVQLGRALELATEAGDVDLISEVLSFKGHLEWMAGHPGAVVGLSAAAQRGDGLYPGQAAISAVQEARGHAMLGDAQAAARKLGEGTEAAARADCQPEGRPPWLYYHTPGFWEIEHGRVWLYLGARDPAASRRAVTLITAGLAVLDETARGSEWAGDYLLHLGRAHLQAGDAEPACAAVAEAGAIARRSGSAVLAARARRLHKALAARWPGDLHVAVLAGEIP